MLIDYADTKDRSDTDDKRADLPKLLWEDLDGLKSDTYRVVAFSHLDSDHVRGAGDFLSSIMPRNIRRGSEPRLRPCGFRRAQ